MKKIALAASVLMMTIIAHAQQNEGKVIYLRTVQMRMQISDDREMAPPLPKSLTDKFELSFGNNQSILKHVDDADATDEVAGESGGMHIRIMTPGQNDVVYCDFSNGKKVEQKEIFDKKYVVTDSIKKMNWKITGETQTILNHVCQKAVALKIGKRTERNIDNGVMSKKEVDDTTNIIAWFTTDIPVSAGPEYPGELPGLILALDLHDGKIVYTATDISEKANLADIKEPTKGKKVTPDQFSAEREKLMNEMQKNQEGGGERRVIRVDH